MNHDMNHLDPAFDPRIADWLETDPDRAPHEVLDTVLAAMPSIPQRRPRRLPWRFLEMPTSTRAAVAAVLGVLLIGGALAIYERPSPDGVGGVQPGPTLTATPSPNPPSPSPSPAALPTIGSADVGKPLLPGSYRVEGFAAPFSVTLPADWIVSDFTPNSLTIEERADGKVNLYMAVIHKVYRDPCHPSSGPSVISPGVDALVAALSSMSGFHVTDVSDATVAGAVGKSFKFGNAIDVAAAKCSGNSLPLATYDKNGTDVDISMFAGERDMFWVVDAGGTTVFLAVTDSNVAAVQPLLDSLSFGDGSPD